MRRPHALRGWSRLRARAAAPSRLLVLVDYDGTLTPIVARPEEAHLSAATRRALRRLLGAPGVHVGVVSGRSLVWLRKRLGLPAAICVGNHGLEIKGRGVAFVHPAARRGTARMRALARKLNRALRGLPGAWVEEKTLSISVHWRGVRPPDVERFHRVVHGVLAADVRRRRVRVTTGKRVIEIRPPVAWDKGRAVAYLRKHLGAASPAVWYLGDDTTDEDAFRVVNRWGGVSVVVSAVPRRSVARWRVSNSVEVREVLQRIARARWTP